MTISLRDLTLIIVVALALNACARTEVVTRYHFLERATASPINSAITSPRIAVAIGPVSVADYLDQPRLAITQANGAVVLHEFDRWAMPLGANIQELIIEEVSSALGDVTVAAFPASQSFKHDYRVVIEILRLDGSPGGDARLQARWRVSAPRNDASFGEFQVDRSRPVAGADHRSIINAQSELVVGLANAIASYLSSLQRP